MDPPKVFGIVQRKGGVGKTTSSVGIASGLAKHGETLLMDEDVEQGSAWKWWAAADGAMPFHALGAVLSSDGPARPGELARQVATLAFRYVVIDTPPGHPDVIREVVLAADELIIPVAPSTIEVNELDRTLKLISDTRPDMPVRILLTRVKTATLLAGGIRTLLAEELKLAVMAAEIPEREAIRGAFGTNDSAEFYVPVVDELMRGVA
jgi:chromosome partitioning protein